MLQLSTKQYTVTIRPPTTQSGAARHWHSIWLLLLLLSSVLVGLRAGHVLAAPRAVEAPPNYRTQWGSQGSSIGQFNALTGVSVNSSGNLYVADTANNPIQKFTNNSVYLTQWESTGNGVGQFSGPRGVALDSSGNIYVTDTGNHRVQVFTYGLVTPEIELRGNLFYPIENGDSTPSSTDHTDFGSISASAGVIVRTFTIRNGGTGLLTVSQPTVTGDAAGDFVISRAPASPVGGSGATIFDVTFDPSAVGLRTATIVIANNDSDENPYTFAIQGNGSNQHRVTTSTVGDGLGTISLDPPGGLYDPGTVVTATVNLGSWSVLSSWSGACSGTGLCVLTMDDAKRITATITYAEPSNAEAPSPYRMQWGFQGNGSSQFATPFGVTTDSSGNVYVADTYNHRIQKFAGSGAYLAGWGSQGSGNGQFNYPIGMATDNSGNLYVADTGNHRIQKFDSSGAYLTKFGAYGVNNGQFSSPIDVAIDSSGNLYVSDNYNHRIQKFDSSGNFLAKWGANGSGAGQLKNPRGIAVDSSGNVYVADTDNHRIQKFDSNGLYLAQWGARGSRAGQFNTPSDVVIDGSGNLYVADTNNHRIQKFTSSGAFLTQWGSAGKGLGQFNAPNSVAVDPSGNVFVADTDNHRIQKFGTSAPVPEIELTGKGVVIVSGDTTPASSDHTDFGYLQGGSTQVRTFTIHNLGSADLTNLAVTISGNAAFSLSTPPPLTISSGYTGAVGITFSAFGFGPMTATVTIASNDSDEAAYTFVVWAYTTEAPPTQLLTWNLQRSQFQSSWPQGVATDSSGNVYVADHNYHEIQKFDSNGLLLTKWGSLGTGPGQFFNPSGVAIDSSGNVYVADKSTSPIQKFDSNGLFLIRWGSEASGPSQLVNVNGIAIDQSNNVYVVSTSTYRIQKFDSNGAYLSGWGSFGSAPGQFDGLLRIAIDSSGNVYTLEESNNRIQKFDSNGVYLGGWGSAGSAPGQFTRPYNIETDRDGSLYVADFGNSRIQKFAPNGVYLTGWAAQGAIGMAADQNRNLYITYGTMPHVRKFGPAPAEIDVRTNGVAIASGDITPASADHTDFGAVNVAGGTVARTFAVHNSGGTVLTDIAATLSGDAAFSLSKPPSATISGTRYTTFTITFAPSVRGVVTALVSLANSDSDENPYTFVIGGMGEQPTAVDTDSDGVADASDNCPAVANADQTNTDGDSQGDACDSDDDNDGISDSAETANGTNPLHADSDGDGADDGSDNCPTLSNADQANTDGDSQGDACDGDDDNDNQLDGSDNCPLVANPDQTNTDGDSQGDACDSDDDNDGISDSAETANGTNPLDNDSDDDLVPDSADSAPTQKPMLTAHQAQINAPAVVAAVNSADVELNLHGQSSFVAPVVFIPNGPDIASVDFVLDYDESCLTFATTGNNGIPNAITGLPATHITTVQADTAAGKLTFLIHPPGNTPPLPLLNNLGTLAQITFGVRNDCVTTNGDTRTVAFSFPDADYGYADGNSLSDQTGQTSTYLLRFNAAPTLISLVDTANGSTPDTTIDENAATGAVVAYLNSTDLDANTPRPGDSHSYSLVSGPGSDNNNLFILSGDQLKAGVSFDFEAKNSYNLRVRSTDQYGLSVEQQLTVLVNDLNEAPTAIDLVDNAVAEQVTGAVVGQLSTDDQDLVNPGGVGDILEAHSYSLPTGQADNDLFEIVGNALQFKAGNSANFEVKNSYSVVVRSSDSANQTLEQAFALVVIDSDENPVATADGVTPPLVVIGGRSTVIDVLANDTDEDGDPLSVIGVGNPTLAGASTAFTPASVGYSAPNQNGQDNFTYTISDGSAPTVDGNVTVQVVKNDPRGDCNSDGAVNAADFPALVLEYFDNDTLAWWGIFPDGFHGSPLGCDANANGPTNVEISGGAGDIICTVLIFFNRGCLTPTVVAAANPQTASASLAVSAGLRSAPGKRVAAPLQLASGGNNIAAATFALTFDSAHFTFDPTDGNDDGLPDAITFNVPATMVKSVTYNASLHRVEVALFGVSLPLPTFKDGVLATVTLQVQPQITVTTAPLNLDLVSLGGEDGQTVAVQVIQGAVEIEGATTVQRNMIYLPTIQK